MQDLKPIIIPPIVDKSSFMSINSLKLIWESARTALRDANKIFILGYSLPESDLTVKLLLKNFIKENAEILIVDIKRRNDDEIINTDNIEHRIRKLFEPKGKINIEESKIAGVEVISYELDRGIKLKCFYPSDEIEEEKIIYHFIERFIPKPNNDICLRLTL